MNRVFCSLSDQKYLLQGLTLYHSLLKVNPNFTLYYLCLDDETFKILSKLNYPNLKLIKLSKLEEDDKLHEYKENNDYKNYCWCLGSYFTNYIMRTYEPYSIMYIDADIFFYQDYELIYDEIGSKSIGIIINRFNHNKETKTGKYNVGIVYFKNDKVGFKCLEWWKSVVLDIKNKWTDEYGSCGDQKYLELFHSLFGHENICVIGKTIGHGASWSLKNQKLKMPFIYWQGQKQLFIFHHFSHFTPDFEYGTYTTNNNNEWRPENAIGGKLLYDDYFEKIKQIKCLI